MLFWHGNLTPIVSVAFWSRDAEAPASSDASASSYRVKENVRVLPIVKAPLKLVQVQRQIFLGDVVIGADHAAFQERPERFDIVGVHVAAYPLFLRMVDALMRASKQPVALILVRSDQRNLVARYLADETGQGGRIQGSDDFADHIAFTLDSSNHANFVEANRIERIGIGVRAKIGAFLVPMPVTVLSTEIGFIGFDYARKLRHFIVSEHGADAVAHIEGGLVCGRSSVLLEHPLHLQGTHALLALTNQIGDFKPERQWIVGVLENRSDERGEAIARFLGTFDDLSGRSVERLSAALTDPVPRPMLDAHDALAPAARAFSARGPTQANQQGHAFVLSVELLMNLSKADHERTLHPIWFWCQVRLIWSFSHLAASLRAVCLELARSFACFRDQPQYGTSNDKNQPTSYEVRMITDDHGYRHAILGATAVLADYRRYASARIRSKENVVAVTNCTECISGTHSEIS
jgi:hypothetical protein